VVLGRQEGQRPSDKKAKRVLAMHREGLSYRLIGRNVGLSKNTVMQIVRREAYPISTRAYTTGNPAGGRVTDAEADETELRQVLPQYPQQQTDSLQRKNFRLRLET
jgi:transposase